MILLNCENEEERDKLTMQWRDHKLNELSFIGVVVRLTKYWHEHCPGKVLSGSEAYGSYQSPLTAVCLVSTGSWPEITAKPWFIRAIWYCGIVFALFSVLTAAQQSLRLHRLSAHRDGLHYIRLCLVRDRKRLDSEEGQLKLVPRPFQVWSWQSSMMFLIMAVSCLLVGMLVLVWVSFWEVMREVAWNDEAKVRGLSHGGQTN
jgi:hypothetical protein